jgi:hypothetical protein
LNEHANVILGISVDLVNVILGNFDLDFRGKPDHWGGAGPRRAEPTTRPGRTALRARM